ncbi:hypothetical protein [Pseudonocardia sp. HH130629-09]|uniref:hypothetical protein n=1 Tax=Pseudonocardia sp. HH130629-09 TaxID=1641402 RepID=UPI0006CB3EB1|nr:hypothetical protein [Pseudonocardia sp. HH130629-09]ALE86572.1 hypothetical protein XF36_28455 [Pseudonocardia sp. HH130629-09]
MEGRRALTGGGPSAEELPDAAVARIQAVSDDARMRYDEVVARDPSVRAAMEGLYGDELSACVHDVRDAYLAEGISRERASQASEAWLIIRSGVRGDLAFGDQIIADLASGKLRRGGRGPGAP